MESDRAVSNNVAAKRVLITLAILVHGTCQLPEGCDRSGSGARGCTHPSDDRTSARGTRRPDARHINGRWSGWRSPEQAGLPRATAETATAPTPAILALPSGRGARPPGGHDHAAVR